MKYSPPGTTPAQRLGDELRHIADALSEVETDTVLLKQWNAEPDKLYDGLVAYADGSNWNPGSGEGFYGYYNAAWHSLG